MIYRNEYKECDECGNNSNFETEGWGEDNNGEYILYICNECGNSFKIYDNEE